MKMSGMRGTSVLVARDTEIGKGVELIMYRVD